MSGGSQTAAARSLRGVGDETTDGHRPRAGRFGSGIGCILPGELLRGIIKTASMRGSGREGVAWLLSGLDVTNRSADGQQMPRIVHAPPVGGFAASIPLPKLRSYYRHPDQHRQRHHHRLPCVACSPAVTEWMYDEDPESAESRRAGFGLLLRRSKMSGGTMDYAYSKVRMIAEQFLEGSEEPLRRVLATELFEIADVLKAIEWSDSGDTAPDEWKDHVRNYLEKRRIDL